MLMKVSMPGHFKFKSVSNLHNVLFSRSGDIHYIGGAEVLPAPLPPSKEQDIINALGTERDQEAKSLLIEHNLRLVVYIAKRFDNTGVGVEDLISIGTIGLIKAINTYNPVKKIKPMTILRRFSVYFQIYIFRKINIFLSRPCLNGLPPLPAKNRPKMNCPIQFVNSLKKGYKFLKIMLK